MSKHARLREALKTAGSGKMKVFGNSMLPLIKPGSLLTYEPREAYEPGDIVFCKVKGRVIDAHKVVKKDAKGHYLIANNKGHENGWTKTIWGKVVKVEEPDG